MPHPLAPLRCIILMSMTPEKREDRIVIVVVVVERYGTGVNLEREKDYQVERVHCIQLIQQEFPDLRLRGSMVQREEERQEGRRRRRRRIRTMDIQYGMARGQLEIEEGLKGVVDQNCESKGKEVQRNWSGKGTSRRYASSFDDRSIGGPSRRYFSDPTLQMHFSQPYIEAINEKTVEELHG
jgi:hypothetical protein